MYIHDIEINGIDSVTFLDKNKAIITLDVDNHISILKEIVRDMVECDMSLAYIIDVVSSVYEEAEYEIYGERK